MSNNGTKDAMVPTTAKPIGAEPIVERGMVIYRPDQLAAAVTDADAQAMIPSLKAMWPQEVSANPVLALTMAKVAIAYRVDPALGHLILYRGKPFFTIEGKLHIAQQKDTFQGVFTRPATEDEKRAWGCHNKPEIFLWRADAYRSDWVDPKTGEMRAVTGWGEVNVLKDQNPVAKEKPNQQAEVRATKRALRSLYTTPLPFADLPDEGENDRDEERVQSAAWVSPDGRILDQRPGGNLLTPGQRASIHSMCKELQIDRERRHALLYGMFGKASSSDLNEGEAAAFIEWLAEKSAPEIVEREDPHAGAIYNPPAAANKRFHTSAAAASFSPPRIVEPESEPERPSSALPEGTILDGPGGQRFVVDNGQLVPFVEAPRVTEVHSPEDVDQAVETPDQGDAVEAAEPEPVASSVEEELTGAPKSGDDQAVGNLPEGIPTALADRVLALTESARSAEPQPWWTNAETVTGNRASARRFLKGPGVKFTDAAVTTLFRLLMIAFSGNDPGAGQSESNLAPAFCAVLQGQGKADLAAMKDDLEMLVLDGTLDR